MGDARCAICLVALVEEEGNYKTLSTPLSDPPSINTKQSSKLHLHSATVFFSVHHQTRKQATRKMGLGNMANVSDSQRHNRTHKVFVLCNYILLGAASSCIFLTLSLRLFPSICGFLLILLHVITIGGAVSGCAAAGGNTRCSGRWYAAHMVATVLTAIFQGSVSVLIFTSTSNFLSSLRTYVREEDAAVILKLAGGLCVLIFTLEWAVLTLAFFLKYFAYVESGGTTTSSSKVQATEDVSDWPGPFQLRL